MSTLNRTGQPPIVSPAQMILYGRALHPTTFVLRNRRAIRGSQYDFEVWIINGLHALRFSLPQQKLSMTELLSDRPEVPAQGIMNGFVLSGEREISQELAGAIRYMTNVQTETLSESVFAENLREIDSTVGAGRSAVKARWRDATGDCLSVIDLQQRPKEIQAECYHFVATGGVVIRTQSVFEHG